jgi:hypothetical protein
VSLALTALSAPAQAQPLSVAVDWSTVPDEAIAKCDLDGLQALLLQNLLERGYAVVAPPVPRDIDVVITWEPWRFVIEANVDGARITRSVSLSRACDSTIVVDLTRAVVSVLDEARRRKAPAGGHVQESVPTHESSRKRTTLRPAVMATAADPRTPLPGVRLGLSVPLPAGTLELGLETVAWRHENLWVLEPAITVGWMRSTSIGNSLTLSWGIELAGMAHTFAFEEEAWEWQADVRAGIPVRLDVGSAVFITAMPYGRLFDLEHRASGETVYRSRRVGMAVFVGVPIPL